jgi:hypothetical protein
VDRYARVLQFAVGAIENARIPHLVFGSIATRALGRHRPIEPDEDIDLFLTPAGVRRAAGVLQDHGFETWEHDPTWIRKASLDGITVDLICRAAGSVYLDADMLRHAVPATVRGVAVRLMPPEDLAVVKAALHVEERPYDWYDAMALLAGSDVDWDRVVRRGARHAAHRTLSLLWFCRAEGVAVPDEAVAGLEAALGGSGPSAGTRDRRSA